MLKYYCSFFAGLLIVMSSSAWALSSQKILQSADEARGNIEGVTWEVYIRSIRQDKETAMTLDVKARGFDVITETVAPLKYKGNKLLMQNGNMWFYKPGLSKPIPISRRQKLLGNAVYGDIAATNYADDYTVSRVAEDLVGREACYKFDLKSKNKKNTYDRIVYWISRERLVGIKADYYTVSGKKFKTAVMEYNNTVTQQGTVRPFISFIKISDELVNDDITSMRFEKPQIRSLEDYLFNLNFLTQ